MEKETTMAYWVTEQIAVSGAAISSENWREYVEKMRITAVVNMRQEYQDAFAPPLPSAYLWLPVVDHTEPTLGQLLMGAQFIDAAVRAGLRVLVHCRAGIGRSPTTVAAYLVWTGMSVEEAIHQVEGTPRRRFGPVVGRYTLQDFAAYLKEQDGPGDAPL
jgi:dual specificity MAP kinase phosphatase